MADISTRLGLKIRKARVSRGLSQEQLAFKSGLHRTYISDVERGTRNISVASLDKVARALQTKVQELFE